jgi:hypothetical protein
VICPVPALAVAEKLTGHCNVQKIWYCKFSCDLTAELDRFISIKAFISIGWKDLDGLVDPANRRNHRKIYTRKLARQR